MTQLSARKEPMAKHRVKHPKIKWSAQIDLGPGTDSFITLSGKAPDARSAALAASEAHQATTDAVNLACLDRWRAETANQ